jgi:hypothetical protein
MNLASRIAQSLALILIAPILWAFGVTNYTLIMLGHTLQGVLKVWK